MQKPTTKRTTPAYKPRPKPKPKPTTTKPIAVKPSRPTSEKPHIEKPIYEKPTRKPGHGKPTTETPSECACDEEPSSKPSGTTASKPIRTTTPKYISTTTEEIDIDIESVSENNAGENEVPPSIDCSEDGFKEHSACNKVSLFIHFIS